MKRAGYQALAAAALLALAGILDSCSIDGGCGCEDEETVMTIEDVGLDTPESVLYDDVADVYLVSNVCGGSGDEDGEAFISRFNPDGTVVNLKWIDSATDGVTLNAPKGMAFFGDELYVADINTLKVFDRTNGAPVREIYVQDASFLNDVVADADGNAIVSDNAQNAVFKVAMDGAWEKLAEGDALGAPNGLARKGEDLWAASWDLPMVYRLDDQGNPTDERETPAAGLDGLLILENGDFIVSSWEGRALFRASEDGSFELLFKDLDAPADLGFDSKRNRVLVPLFKSDKIVIKQLH